MTVNLTIIGPVYPYRGGIAYYTMHLARALQRAGHTVQVISFQRQYPAWLYPGSSDKDPSQQTMRVEAEYLLDPLYPWTWQRAAQSIGQQKPDWVVINWWTTFWAPAFAVLAGMLRRQGQRVAFLIHNTLPHEQKPWDRWLARAALRHGQAFIVLTPSEQERLDRLIPQARCQVCLQPMYERFGDAPIPREAARQQLGLPAQALLFLFFGIVRPYKGLKYLIEALSQVESPIHLVAAGDFWEDVGEYRQQIQRLGLGERVHLRDHYIPNEEAHLLFSAADALVAPYTGGTQSAVVNVALSYGLPMIVSTQVAAGLNMAEHLPITIVPPGDTAALAQALRGLAARLPASLNAAGFSADSWEPMVKAITAL